VENCRHKGGVQERHCSHCGKYGHLVEKCWKKGDDSRSNVPKSITQSAQVANASTPKDAEIDSKNITEELKQLREEVKRQTTQYGNSLFAETTRVLMVKHLPIHSDRAYGQRGLTFVCDSGATSHMVNDASLFMSFVGCDVEVSRHLLGATRKYAQQMNNQRYVPLRSELFTFNIPNPVVPKTRSIRPRAKFKPDVSQKAPSRRLYSQI
jgi:hypothetical protein